MFFNRCRFLFSRALFTRGRMRDELELDVIRFFHPFTEPVDAVGNPLLVTFAHRDNPYGQAATPVLLKHCFKGQLYCNCDKLPAVLNPHGHVFIDADEEDNNGW